MAPASAGVRVLAVVVERAVAVVVHPREVGLERRAVAVLEVGAVGVAVEVGRVRVRERQITAAGVAVERSRQADDRLQAAPDPLQARQGHQLLRAGQGAEMTRETHRTDALALASRVYVCQREADAGGAVRRALA